MRTSARNPKPRAPAMSNARASITSIARRWTPTVAANNSTSERTGLDLAALADAFAGIQAQHDTQKQSLDALNADVEARKQAARRTAGPAARRAGRARRSAQAGAGQRAAGCRRWKRCSTPRSARSRAPRRHGCRRAGLDSAARVGEKLVVEAGLGKRRRRRARAADRRRAGRSARSTGRCAGRTRRRPADAGVARRRRRCAIAPTSLAAKVQGPAAIRRILSKLHAAETLADARAMLPQLGDGESVITRQGERLGAGWVRVLRSGAAKQGALLREREIQSLRARDRAAAEARTARSNDGADRLRDRAARRRTAARGRAARVCIIAHRSVSELAGQLQSQQGRLDSARDRIERIDAETAQLVATLDSQPRAGARGARAAGRGRRAAWPSWKPRARRSTPSAARSAKPATPRAPPHANRATPRMQLALTLESQRAQIVALAQSLERMGGQRGQLDIAPGRTGLAADATAMRRSTRWKPSARPRWKSASAPRRRWPRRARRWKASTTNCAATSRPATSATSSRSRSARRFRSASSTSRRWCSRPTSCPRPWSRPASCSRK